jgi:GntR family transcriptional regulator / MocR family aminotransferase
VAYPGKSFSASTFLATLGLPLASVPTGGDDEPDQTAGAASRIIEDDYDSEYRYATRPFAALEGLDRDERVGTFTMVMFSPLRLGYLVVPPDLVDAFVATRALADRHSALLDQVALTDFIAKYYFARHIRRMRALYAAWQAALVEAAGARVGGAARSRTRRAGDAPARRTT